MRRILVYLLAIAMFAASASATESDLDGDGETNDVDLDIDGDGLDNLNDTCPLVFGTSSLLEFGCPDYDEDGIRTIWIGIEMVMLGTMMRMIARWFPEHRNSY